MKGFRPRCGNCKKDGDVFTPKRVWDNPKPNGKVIYLCKKCFKEYSQKYL